MLGPQDGAWGDVEQDRRARWLDEVCLCYDGGTAGESKRKYGSKWQQAPRPACLLDSSERKRVNTHPLIGVFMIRVLLAAVCAPEASIPTKLIV